MFVFLVISKASFATQVDKTKLVLNLDPGETYSDVITFDNPSPDFVTVRVYLEDFRYTEPFKSDKEFYPPSSSEFTLADCISFSPKEFTVQPHSKFAVNFKLTMPDDFRMMKSGVLFFELSLGSGFDKSGKQVTILSRVGTLFFIHSNSANREAQIVDVSAGESSVDFALENTGEKFMIPNGSYYVMDSEGLMVDRSTIDSRYLMPGDKAKVSLDLNESEYSRGEYFMVLSYDLEEGAAVVKEIDFEVGPGGLVTITDTRD